MYGKITYLDNISLKGGQDINSLVEISYNDIYVDSGTEPKLNKSAKIELYGIDYEFTPYIMFENEFGFDELCADCIFDSYGFNKVTFNVSHFTAYKSSANSKLTIFDSTDPQGGSTPKYKDENVLFYANYTNITSGQSLNGTNVFCNITFDDINAVMIFNSTSKLYYYNRSFSAYGMYDWLIVCNASAAGFENLAALDNVPISSEIPASIKTRSERKLHFKRIIYGRIY